jgi:hypothetical protein
MILILPMYRRHSGSSRRRHATVATTRPEAANMSAGTNLSMPEL